MNNMYESSRLSGRGTSSSKLPAIIIGISVVAALIFAAVITVAVLSEKKRKNPKGCEKEVESGPVPIAQNPYSKPTREAVTLQER